MERMENPVEKVHIAVSDVSGNVSIDEFSMEDGENGQAVMAGASRESVQC